MNVCKNNHLTENKDGQIIILGNCVIHCHKCGYTITIEKVTALYGCDEYAANDELYHIYYFYPKLFCKYCGNEQTTYAVRCYSIEEALANYESYKTASNIIRGVVQ